MTNLKAVIPVAGLGMHMLPATKAIPKDKLQRYCPASYPYPEFLKHLEKQRLEEIQPHPAG